MVIAKTVMSTDHKTQKESYARRSADFFFFFFFFFCFQNVSCGVVYSFAAFARDKKCSRESICVCAYVRVAVT